MDGFAVAIDSLEPGAIAELEEIGSAFAGKPFTGTVGPSNCVRIMTGAAVPGDCDTIVMQEHAEARDDGIVIDSGHKVGQNVREAVTNMMFFRAQAAGDNDAAIF